MAIIVGRQLKTSESTEARAGSSRGASELVALVVGGVAQERVLPILDGETANELDDIIRFDFFPGGGIGNSQDHLGGQTVADFVGIKECREGLGFCRCKRYRGRGPRRRGGSGG